MDTKPAMQTFEDFVETALPRLVRFATWVGGPAGDPEDLVQDALERVGMKWRSMSGSQAQAEAYVRRAIVNGHVSRWRSRRREHLVETPPERYSVPGVAGDPRHGEVWQAVTRLPRGQRAVVVLRFFEDLSVAETAAALGLAEGTVKAHTHRALDSLRTSLHTAGQAEASLAFAASVTPLPVTVPGAGRELTEAVGSRRRRRNAAVVGAATACVVAVIAVASIAWPFGRGDRVQPVIPAPSVEPTTLPAVPVPTVPEPSAAPATDVTTPSAGEAVQPPPSAGAGELDLATYRLAIEDSPVRVDADINHRADPEGTWPLDPCQPTTYPTDAQRQEFVAAGYGLGDGSAGSYVARYPDAVTASDVLAGFVRAVQACGRVDEPQVSDTSNLIQWSLPVAPEIGDEAVAALSSEYFDDSFRPGVDFIVVRVDSYVVMTYSDHLYKQQSTEAERLTEVTEGAIAETDRLKAALAQVSD